VKRAALAARVELLLEKQQQLEDAARALVKKLEQGQPGAYAHEVHAARRALATRAIEFGTACRRYLGGAT
jgi:hypothetical protein